MILYVYMYAVRMRMRKSQAGGPELVTKFIGGVAKRASNARDVEQNLPHLGACPGRKEYEKQFVEPRR